MTSPARTAAFRVFIWSATHTRGWLLAPGSWKTLAARCSCKRTEDVEWHHQLALPRFEFSSRARPTRAAGSWHRVVEERWLPDVVVIEFQMLSKRTYTIYQKKSIFKLLARCTCETGQRKQTADQGQRPQKRGSGRRGKRTRPRTTVEHRKISVTADEDAVGQGGERGEE